MIEYNKIYNEDCLIGMKNIPNRSVELILTDPPYGLSAAKWDEVLPMNKLWTEYKRVITDNGVIVMFGQEPFSSRLRLSNLPMYRFDITWMKQKPSNFQLMNYQPGRMTENIMVFSKSKACYTRNGVHMTYNPQLIKRQKPRKSNVKIYGHASLLHSYHTEDNMKIYEYRQPHNIVKYNTVTKNKRHPTEKPVELLEYLIKTFSNEGDIVLDSCMGVGSTCVAAKETHRKYIGFETDLNYFNIANERLNEIK